jgi:hypothetical protein
LGEEAQELSLLSPSRSSSWLYGGFRLSEPNSEKFVQLNVQGFGPSLQHLKRRRPMAIFRLGDISLWQSSQVFNVTLAQTLGFPQLSKSFADVHNTYPPNDRSQLPLPRSEGKVKIYSRNAMSETKNITATATRTSFSA